MKRTAWIIFGGVIYMVAMSALGRRLKRNAEFDATLHAPPRERR